MQVCVCALKLTKNDTKIELSVLGFQTSSAWNGPNLQNCHCCIDLIRYTNFHKDSKHSSLKVLQSDMKLVDHKVGSSRELD